MLGLFGDLAIWTLIFIAGFFCGKKFETLGDVGTKIKTTVSGWFSPKAP